MKLRARVGAIKKKRIVGRGSGTGVGCTCGRGDNGQKSRSGYSRQIGFEGGQMPLARRLPKIGFNNKAFEHKFQIINIGDLNRYSDGDTIDYNILLKDRLVKKKCKFVKLLGNGELTKKVHVIVHKATEKAREAVEKLDGKVEIVS